MIKIFNKPYMWVKQNKVASVLILVVVYLAFAGKDSNQIRYANSGVNSFGMVKTTNMVSSKMDGGVTSMMQVADESFMAPAPEAVVTSTAARKTISNVYFSVLVKSVESSLSKITNAVADLNGYVVTVNMNNATEGSETGYMSLRVPNDKLDTLKATLKESSIKIVSENANGEDVTDSFYDAEARLAKLQVVLTKFEGILTEAKTVAEILQVQREIMTIQSQIESVQGQLKYMGETTKTTLVTVNLSTNELALPYAPENVWQPDVVVKLAVRSVLTNLASLGHMAIWIAVYSVLWVPALVIGWVIKTRILKK